MLKPSDKAVRDYYRAIEDYDRVGAAHEGAVRTAFGALLAHAARDEGWTLVPEFTMNAAGGRRIRLDGALRDSFGLTHGLWEAKDTADDLEREVQKKFDAGYPRDNIVFQAPRRAILVQDGRVVLDTPLDEPAALVDVVRRFLAWRAPAIARFHDAVDEFKARIPELGAGLLERIREAEKDNADFRDAFGRFVALCRESINPNLAEAAVEEMLIQHLLTERLFRRVFGSDQFAHRNPIAVEIERVVAALTSQSFSRQAFLGSLDRFYTAIEDAAATIADFSEKQAFLNTVYERFFQGFSVKAADTHGIVYTPQPLVDFMVRSVDALLEDHFSTRLSSEGVHVLDPFVGTGNFLLRVMEAVPTTRLEPKYRDELHANEVMLLPYYIASLNMEHRFLERTGHYEPFPGIVLVDTFDMVEGKTIGAFTAENTERAVRQRASPIKVVIGNPPYNAHQVNANDRNQNRKYSYLDRRVRDTFSKASKAVNKNALSDPYVKAFRWAADRLGDAGIVAYVTNGSFFSDLSFDGMRKSLAAEFDAIYHVNLKGNARTSGERRRQEGGNIFDDQIRVSVGVTFLVRTKGKGIRPRSMQATIRYAEVADYQKADDKRAFLEAAGDVRGVDWQTLAPRADGTWLTEGMQDEWGTMLPMGSSAERTSDARNRTTLFDQFSRGAETGRDAWVYDFDPEKLAARVEGLVDTYNGEVAKWLRHPKAQAKKKTERAAAFDATVSHDDRKIKWSESLKNAGMAGIEAGFDPACIRRALYRPFVPKWLYYDDLLVHRPGGFRRFFPTLESEAENRVIVVSDQGWRSPFAVLVTDRIPDLHLCAASDAFQCFPLYVYDADGTNRRDNVTDWALERFRAHYADPLPRPPAGPRLSPLTRGTASGALSGGAADAMVPEAGGQGEGVITKEDLFHYAYAVLHHPAYRARYAADLKRSLPRLPMAPQFRPFAEAGRALAALHIGFESAPEYPLREEEAPGAALDWRIEKMAWADKEKTALRLNGFLTLSGIPEEAHAYRFGNRSALDWLVDQLRVKTEPRSAITHDPNAAADPERIARLVRQVTHVSVETARIVASLPDLGLPGT